MKILTHQARQLVLHKRATTLLELLKKAQSRKQVYEVDLYNHRSDGANSYVSENEILIKIARMNAIQKRILQSYHFLIVELYQLTDDFILPVNLIF